MHKYWLLLAISLGLTAAQPAGAAGDAVAGALKKSMCAGCHGLKGWRTAYPEVYSVPRLGNQHPEYIVKALQAYKSGTRGHATMRAIASNLDEQDMADLAAYYGAAPQVQSAK
ncbi:MAG: c-type cytochrome [Burkholderiales bacterium]